MESRGGEYFEGLQEAQRWARPFQVILKGREERPSLFGWGASYRFYKDGRITQGDTVVGRWLLDPKARFGQGGVGVSSRWLADLSGLLGRVRRAQAHVRHHQDRLHRVSEEASERFPQDDGDHLPLIVFPEESGDGEEPRYTQVRLSYHDSYSTHLPLGFTHRPMRKSDIEELTDLEKLAIMGNENQDLGRRLVNASRRLSRAWSRYHLVRNVLLLALVRTLPSPKYEPYGRLSEGPSLAQVRLDDTVFVFTLVEARDKWAGTSGWSLLVEYTDETKEEHVIELDLSGKK